MWNEPRLNQNVNCSPRHLCSNLMEQNCLTSALKYYLEIWEISPQLCDRQEAKIVPSAQQGPGGFSPERGTSTSQQEVMEMYFKTKERYFAILCWWKVVRACRKEHFHSSECSFRSLPVWAGRDFTPQALTEGRQEMESHFLHCYLLYYIREEAFYRVLTCDSAMKTTHFFLGKWVIIHAQ